MNIKSTLRKPTNSMIQCFRPKIGENGNAVGLNAVHCAISSSDAMLVFYAGICSTSDDHLSVIDLLSNSVRLPEVKSKCEILRKIYENRDFIQKEALEMLKLTERFYTWVVSKIGF